MVDRLFFPAPEPVSLGFLARLVEADCPHPDRETILIRDIASLADAGAHELCYLDSERHLKIAAKCRATACLVKPAHSSALPSRVISVLSEHPRLAYSQIATRLYGSPPLEERCHRTASIDKGAIVHPSCTIENGAIIKSGASIGAHTFIGAHTVIGANCQIGTRCVIADQCSIGYARIGNCVRIQSGTRIGGAGFGFIADTKPFIDVPHLGSVVIEDHVSIGANCAIDRGTDKQTRIGKHTRIDNLCHIAHNVVIGKYCVLSGQCGIAGSVRIDDECRFGGQAGISDHVRLGSGVVLIGQAGVIRDIPARGRYMGMPARPVRDAFRLHALLGRMLRGSFSDLRDKGK